MPRSPLSKDQRDLVIKMINALIPITSKEGLAKMLGHKTTRNIENYINGKSNPEEDALRKITVIYQTHVIEGRPYITTPDEKLSDVIELRDRLIEAKDEIIRLKDDIDKLKSEKNQPSLTDMQTEVQATLALLKKFYNDFQKASGQSNAANEAQTSNMQVNEGTQAV